MMDKINLIIEYRVVEDDSDHMVSDTIEQERYEISASTKEEILEFLKSLEDIRIRKDLLDDLEQDAFVLDNKVHQLYTDSDSQGWVSTSFSLQIKSKDLA